MRTPLLLGCALLGGAVLLGCAKSAPPAKSPEAKTSTPAASAPPAAQAAEDSGPPRLPAAGPGEPEPKATCPIAAPLPSSARACPQALPHLAQALGRSSGARDAALAELEVCSEFARGMIRALRARLELGCADRLVEPVVGEGAAEASLDTGARELLVALGLAGRLSRLVGEPPQTTPHASKAELEHYLAEHLFPWATKQAVAIGELSRRGARLRGYARGVVAIEAALADLRFVEMARGLPLPVEMQDAEVQTEYYAALDQALEPRKARARDAALVALGEFSAVGITQSPELASARQLISQVFAGNRIVALDVLLVPPSAGCDAKTPEEVIAAAVESPFASALLALGEGHLTPGLTRCLLGRGLGLDVARQLEADLSPESRLLLARAHFELGRTYMKAGAFARAAELYGKSAAEGPLSPADQLLSALARVLTAVPESAVDLFRIGPRLPSALGETQPLDQLTQTSRPFAGAAAFDAAYLRELTAPDGSVSHFEDVAVRYESAQKKLVGSERALAADRARAARATAKALASQLN